MMEIRVADFEQVGRQDTLALKKIFGAPRLSSDMMKRGSQERKGTSLDFQWPDWY